MQDEPRDWLKPPAPKPSAKALAEPVPPPNIAQPTHETLADLQDWLASSMQLPLASPTAKRVLPQGPEEAAVMLLTDAPTFEDFTAGQPIGGDAWELTKRMLSASLDAASLAAHIDHEGLAQLFVRLTTRNFEEAVAARRDKRAPEFKD